MGGREGLRSLTGSKGQYDSGTPWGAVSPLATQEGCVCIKHKDRRLALHLSRNWLWTFFCEMSVENLLDNVLRDRKCGRHIRI